ncbi:hypothetical protein, unlikely [Trypanosoma brucei gambiense DAL972]|uniref:Uncharacterized protein n=1 Tax=Trypanosoma brucei gambiense (strain MHOM/CI/86/DAL972) TaxID=679716 RepID=C9ZLX4_TRYB9|nr:hypothetical protein, unlikely [Trypanosoma brucei gambiense DAL972]CBH10399.1 hypothetical protein, unlikely [Trypanosoma brucei gambiense DAL972]|eukprot:XP_011772689.1 hypothetical protein, unlikely [Trypanosoma brucei gambiense DAL972]
MAGCFCPLTHARTFCFVFESRFPPRFLLAVVIFPHISAIRIPPALMYPTGDNFFCCFLCVESPHRRQVPSASSHSPPLFTPSRLKPMWVSQTFYQIITIKMRAHTETTVLRRRDTKI